MTEAELKIAVHYNPDTGVFKWADGRHFAGKVAGCVGGSGYRRIAVAGIQMMAHRLAWLYMTGHWPDDMIDHINGDRDDNRFVNLRQCNRSQNIANANRRKVSKTGYQGVYFDAKRKRYIARIHVRGKSWTIGRFKNAVEAHDAYLIEHRRCHGDFSSVG